ncbi:hypothetical protein CspeluHIS016_0502620 [Cutaneotrichosporon spelunceum]|uniref:Transketolase-like pyrimidine-binding domain-containing protein n=1 Tax=Cutaneotrichosporon spelunceum TaxID=1672016 RepID=A0AAD3TWJ4_9TREE|nr:hypothetical protein CspeluHIS016_0502620 [Cutaneotrichosporon spelunceum]
MLRAPRHTPRLAGLLRARRYHDDASFGYRVPSKYTLPDYTAEELANRNENAALLRYVEMMRRHGHRAAKVDPLDLMERDPVSALDPYRYGLSDDTKYPLKGIMHLPQSGDVPRTQTGEGTDASRTLKEITEHLMGVYVDRIGYEFQQCPSKDERLWFQHHVETNSSSLGPVSDSRNKRIWGLLSRSEEFDRFLGKKFPNLKRYGCEGAESMLPALDTLFELGAKADLQSIVVSLPHRGRLNLLTEPELFAYSPTGLFSKIKGQPEFDPSTAPGATGDVISHLGGIRELDYDGRKVKVEMLQNPSHLEAVNPVALGITRAKQMKLLKESPADCQLGDRVLCVQLHGDAAFSGQGVVAESLGLSGLPHYGSGGTIHMIVNNNIGYTTPATFSRSAMYASDVGKMIGCPILHVNGDYPEDVVRAVDIAFQYREMFRKDIIIDLICYRRWGHNELDEPGYTQPLMYEKIRSRKSVPELFEERLTSASVLSEADASAGRAAYNASLDKALAGVPDYKPPSEMLGGKWKDMVWPASAEAKPDPETGLPIDRLVDIGKKSVELPADFNVHSRLKRHITSRLKGLESKVDFATAEAMAFGSLLQDGNDVRISGQDVGRGTFSQRHAMFVDQKDESCYVPLNDSLDAPGKLELCNSSLSEMAVLGFEIGMSWANPRLLPIWEAQFGDFHNTAASMIDTFLVGSQAKWLKQTGLVMQLPHGFDGAGPEHSSCKVERFLQLSDDGTTPTHDVNLQVANPSTPAQLYHLLRRQMLRNYRKPLIIASPKGLLRAPIAASPLADMAVGTRFQPVIADETENASRVILCSGKHYYTLLEAANARGIDDIAFIRVEELSPFPAAQVADALSRHPPSTQVVWAQEEPANQGAWSFVAPRLNRILEDRGGEPAEYAGRKASATTATGVGAWHKEEAAEIVAAALDG